MRRPEQSIQSALFGYLRWRAAPGVFAFHPANGGYRRPIEAAVPNGCGVIPGVPDVIIIHNGRTFALELKSETGKLTAVQSACHDALRAAGATVATAYGIDQAVEFLEQHGLLRDRRRRYS